MSRASREAVAFNAYVDLGPSRSLVKLHAHLKVEGSQLGFSRPPSLRTLEGWSAAGRWPERIQDLERRAQIEEEDVHVQRIRDYRKRLIQEGLLLQQKGIAWLSARDADDVRTGDAIRAISEGFRLEALALGEVTDRIAVEEDYSHVISKLDDDELERLVEALRTAPAPAPA